MILHLIKKDILLAKKYVLIVMLVAVLIPILVLIISDRTGSSLPGFVPLLYMVVLTQLVLLQNISHLEYRSPKAPALICASPYTRKSFVIAKYAVFVLLFVYCLIAYSVVALVVDSSKLLDLTSILAVLLIGVTLYGIYMPVEFKYGVIKTRFIFMVTLLLIPLGPVLFMEPLVNTITLDIELFLAMPSAVANSVLAAASTAIYMISMIVSMKVFANKDL
jgi:ABC-2 type transport system permease protein